jgi:pimeloyl-ACP methyl ester carboxylesterase
MNGLPSYCQARPGDERAVRLQTIRVVVPACQYHAAATVEVRVGGHGFAFVVAHGYIGRSRIYLLLLGLLARWFKVVGVDLAGHGGTSPLKGKLNTIDGYADLLLCTMDALGIERAIIVGHSLGGQVAAAAVSRSPDRCIAQGLVNAIVGTWWDERRRQVKQSFLCWRVLPVIWQVVRHLVRLYTRIKRTDGDRTLLALSTDTFGRYFLRPWLLVPPMKAMLNGPPTVALLESIGIQAPGITFVLWGDGDPIEGADDARSAVELTHGQLIAIPQGGHSWPLEDRNSLPAQVEHLLQGRLGFLLSHQLTGARLDPRTTTPADIEAHPTFYRPGAPVLNMGYDAPWEGHHPHGLGFPYTRRPTQAA